MTLEYSSGLYTLCSQLLQLRLGSSVDSPEVAALVYCELCPAVERVVAHGMRDFESGVHLFGKVKLSPWRVAEMTAELGYYLVL